MGYYERLGEILRDRLATDDDPFADIEDFEAERQGGQREAFGGKARQEEEKPFPKKEGRAAPVPQELSEDFLVLGLRPGDGAEECKSAWKRLLKTHHPDRHQGSEEEKKAAEQATINITRAYRRVMRWLATGELPKD